MTREFNVKYTCSHCGRQTTAETGFGRWMRNQTALDSVSGIVRTDTDHTILRYKTSLDQRDFQLLMIVEVKEFGAEPRPDQVDILSFLRQAIELRQQNHYQREAGQVGGNGSFKLRSKMNNRMVRVRFLGVHLLQFEKTNPADSRWIKWNRKPIDSGTLLGVLAMERDPKDPSRMMIEFLRDRHRKNHYPDLFELSLTAQ